MGREVAPMPAVEKTIKFSELVSFSDKQQQAHEALGEYKFILYGGA